MRRFPLRTLLLMLLALAAFFRLWWITHRQLADARPTAIHVTTLPMDSGADIGSDAG